MVELAKRHEKALEIAQRGKLTSDLVRAYLELRDLAIAALKANEKAAKAERAYEVARNNFSQDDYEAKAYRDALLKAAKTEQQLREALGVVK